MLGGSNSGAIQLDELTDDQVSEFGNKELLELQREIDREADVWKRRLDKLQSGLDKKFGPLAVAKRNASGNDTGTVHVDSDGTDITCELQKRVEWDQEKLDAEYRLIHAAAQNPLLYMTIEYKIPEAVYNNFPPDVKARFLPARTVKPGKPKYTIDDPDAPKKSRGRR